MAVEAETDEWCEVWMEVGGHCEYRLPLEPRSVDSGSGPLYYRVRHEGVAGPRPWIAGPVVDVGSGAAFVPGIAPRTFAAQSEATECGVRFVDDWRRRHLVSPL